MLLKETTDRDVSLYSGAPGLHFFPLWGHVSVSYAKLIFKGDNSKGTTSILEAMAVLVVRPIRLPEMPASLNPFSSVIVPLFCSAKAHLQPPS